MVPAACAIPVCRTVRKRRMGLFQLGERPLSGSGATYRKQLREKPANRVASSINRKQRSGLLFRALVRSDAGAFRLRLEQLQNGRALSGLFNAEWGVLRPRC